MNNSLHKSDISGNTEVALQPASADIWDTKYNLKNKVGDSIDGDIDGTYQRIARALSEIETTDQGAWYKKFLWALRQGVIPAGRIISNAGALEHKPATSTINCTVSGFIQDSMDDILSKVHDAGLTLKAGSGIGYYFGSLRPKNAYVAGSGSYTSGSLSFMDIYDKMCFTVSSAGGRRGAQMATMDIHHPDVLDFIKAKRENGRLRQFNLSVLIGNDFIDAVKADRDWRFSFPITLKEAVADEIDVENSDKIVWRKFPIKSDEYIVNSDGLTACRIYRTMKSSKIWNIIMSSTYDFAEPGFILIDRVNEMNNNWWCEVIMATNPCAEQALPPYGACLLGSINLTKLVINPFTENAKFDFTLFNKLVRIFTRMLDNVVEINGLPLPQQREEIFNKRRHGMGYLGLGSTLSMLQMKYGSDASIEFTEKVTREMAISGWKAGLELAHEKGPAPIMNEDFEVTSEMLFERPEMITDGFKIGHSVKGSVLHAKYSRYMQRLAEVEPALVQELSEVGARFTHHSSIAPTGTISLSLANNASNGIEPSFAHYYSRNVIREGKKTKEKVSVYSYELLAYRALVDPSAMPDPDQSKGQTVIPEYFSTTDDVTPEAHIKIQAAAQKWIDSSISKTVNVDTNIDFEAFRKIYLQAADSGLKGCTTFRFNPEQFQGVLVKEEDLANTSYSFQLDNGESIVVKGNDEIEYDGEMHTAANLYDALKEGQYGKF